MEGMLKMADYGGNGSDSCSFFKKEQLCDLWLLEVGLPFWFICTEHVIRGDHLSRLSQTFPVACFVQQWESSRAGTWEGLINDTICFQIYSL